MVLVLLAPTELDPDAGHYLSLARDFSWNEPWAASGREPFFVGVMKLASAPFGYAPAAVRAASTLFSIGAMVIATAFFFRVLPRAEALIATALVAFNGLLIFIAPRGLREDVTMLLLMSSALLVVGRGRYRWLSSGFFIGLVAGIRWEMSIYAVVLLVVLGLWRRRELLRAAVAALIVAAVVSGPWLVANSHRYADPLAHSVYSATWFRDREDDPPNVDLQYEKQGPNITWGEYYLEFLGPAEAARRLVVGVPALSVDLTAQWVFPVREERFRELHPAAPAVLPFLRVATFVFVAIGLPLTIVGAYRGRRRILHVSAVLVTIGGVAFYAPLERFLSGNYRLLAFTVPFQAMLIATGAARLLRADGSSQPQAKGTLDGHPEQQHSVTPARDVRASVDTGAVADRDLADLQTQPGRPKE